MNNFTIGTSGYSSILNIRALTLYFGLIFGLLGFSPAAVSLVCSGDKATYPVEFNDPALAGQPGNQFRVTRFEHLGNNMYALKVAPLAHNVNPDQGTENWQGALLWVQLQAEDRPIMKIVRSVSLQDIHKKLPAYEDVTLRFFRQLVPYSDGSFTVLYTGRAARLKPQPPQESGQIYLARFDAEQKLLWDQAVFSNDFGLGVYKIMRFPASDDNPQATVMLSGIPRERISVAAVQKIGDEAEHFRMRVFDVTGSVVANEALVDGVTAIGLIEGSNGGYMESSIVQHGPMRRPVIVFHEPYTQTNASIAPGTLFRQPKHLAASYGNKARLLIPEARILLQTMTVSMSPTAGARRDSSVSLGFGALGTGAAGLQQLPWSRELRIASINPGDYPNDQWEDIFNSVASISYLGDQEILVRDGWQFYLHNLQTGALIREGLFSYGLGIDDPQRAESSFPATVTLSAPDSSQTDYEEAVAWVNGKGQLEMGMCSFDDEEM
ncbi:hypothetical protein [Spongorhabdus nitratireducens]